jgi:hypothetical protein
MATEIRADHPFWQRGALNRQGGWATKPGSAAANSAVAEACAIVLSGMW